MKKCIVLILLSLTYFHCFSQHSYDISIGVIVPEQQKEVGRDAFRLLETKLKSIAAKNGISSDLYGSFVMYPTINVIDQKLVEGGMRNIHMVEVEVSLFVRQLNTKAEFGSCSVTLSGSGRSMSDAIKSVFSNIKPEDKTYTYFLTDVKKKIRDYYVANKESMMQSAKSMASLQQYDQAIALLMTYPQSLQGADEIRRSAIDIYKKYQNAVCSSIIAEAKGAISLQDYEMAVNILASIDSESICQSDALKLVEQIDNSIKAEQKREFDLQNKIIDNEMALKNKRIDNETALENKRIDAIREIAVEYVKNQPDIYYNEIIIW